MVMNTFKHIWSDTNMWMWGVKRSALKGTMLSLLKVFSICVNIKWLDYFPTDLIYKTLFYKEIYYVRCWALYAFKF